MAFDFATLLASTRQTVHNTFGCDGSYTDTVTTVPVGLRVRWHPVKAMFGDLDNQGYANVLDQVNTVIFDKNELALKGIVLRAAGTVVMSDPLFNGAALSLSSKMPDDGPTEEVWMVVKTK
jgi:hypothetical protein